MKLRLLEAALAVALPALGVVLSQGAGAESAPSQASMTLLAAQGKALAIATEDGEANPQIAAAQTTLAKAVAVATPGETAPNFYNPQTQETWATSSPVVIVTMTGHFTLHNVPIQKNAALPTGSVITLMYEPMTESLISESIKNGAAPDLDELGTTVVN
jgi:hypothetical protein